MESRRRRSLFSSFFIPDEFSLRLSYMYETSRPSRNGGHIALDHFLVVEADDLVGAIISFFIIKAVWEKEKTTFIGATLLCFLGSTFLKGKWFCFFFFVLFSAFLVRMLAGCWGPRGSDKCQLIAIKEFNQEKKQAREKEEKEKSMGLISLHLVSTIPLLCDKSF